MYKRGQATDFSLEISEAFYVQEVFYDIHKEKDIKQRRESVQY